MSKQEFRGEISGQVAGRDVVHADVIHVGVVNLYIISAETQALPPRAVGQALKRAAALISGWHEATVLTTG